MVIPPIRHSRDYAPVEITVPKPGMFVVDFGQNIAGVCRLVLPEGLRTGQTITIRHAEELNEDGTLDITLSKEAPEDPSNWLPVSDGEFHLFMRIYLPDMNALDAWQPPVIHIQE